MATDDLHVRVALLNPGIEVTPLKFRSWLREEAADVDRKTQASGMSAQVSVIRLFLPNKLRFAIGQAKLDRIFQNIVDKFATIHRIELQAVEAPLSFDDMVRAQSGVQNELEALREEVDRAKSSDEGPTIH